MAFGFIYFLKYTIKYENYTKRLLSQPFIYKYALS